MAQDLYLYHVCEYSRSEYENKYLKICSLLEYVRVRTSTRPTTLTPMVQNVLVIRYLTSLKNIGLYRHIQLKHQLVCHISDVVFGKN